MTNKVVSRRYATAIFALAKAGDKLDLVRHDLRMLADSIQGKPEVWRFFVSPVVDRLLKSELLERTFGAYVDSISLNTLLLLVRKRREMLLPSIVAAYEDLVLMAKNRQTLTLISSRPLEGEDLEQILARLSHTYGKQFEASTSVDDALLGGLQITMGDRYIDGSVSGRLDELARKLFADHRAAYATRSSLAN
jgi:F-type H+-transporting ATPase subunit delta